MMLKVTDFYRYPALFILAFFLLFFSCDLYSIESEVQSDSAVYFSASYQEARLKFLDAVYSSKGKVESFENPIVGPDNQSLFIDVAIFGPANPPDILLLSSGTHGVEGFAGSAIQTGLLQQGILKQLGSDTGLIMIHAVNPYGFAYLRRMNEDNVDLNRNFLAHASKHPDNPGYEELAKSIAPQSISLWSNIKARLHLLFYRIWHGTAALRTAISKGQYSHPSGLFYGGLKASWSNKIIRSIAKQQMANAKRVMAIDFHTGLGAYGEAELRMNVSKESPVYSRAISCWGDPVKITAPHGTLIKALPEMMPETEVTAFTLEFGTVPPLDVFWALRAENWLHHHGQEGETESGKIKKNLLKVFYPGDAHWKQQVWLQGKAIVDQTLECLKSVEYQRQ